MRAFVDTNVVLDVVAERKPFYGDSVAVWTLAEQGKLDGFVSALSFAHVFYMVKKWTDAGTARRALVMMRDTFSTIACSEAIIHQAIDSGLADFEDAIQYYSAVRADADCILTRNAGDFPTDSVLPVLSPKEFLAQLQAE